jgi:putative acetyltransferase
MMRRYAAWYRAMRTFSIRRGRPGDALAILEAHRSSVRGIAASAYSPKIVDGWAPVTISSDRTAAFARAIERGDEVILVAEDATGGVIGFGSIVPGNSELRALYVSAEHERKGIGRAILSQLEVLAREAGVTALRMDSSTNAAGFYEANGYIALERGEHTLQSGVRMACVRMRKSLHPEAGTDEASA